MTTTTRNRSHEAGLSLTELLVASSILVIFTAMLFGTFQMESQTFNRQTAQNVTQSTLRIWLARMVHDIREACYDPSEAGLQIKAHGDSEFRFQTAVDSNGDGVVDATGNGGYRWDTSTNQLTLWLGGSSYRPVVDTVTNLHFTYRDAQGRDIGTTDAVCSSIALVEIEISAQSSTGGYPGSPPPVITEKASAEIRNDIHC